MASKAPSNTTIPIKRAAADTTISPAVSDLIARIRAIQNEIPGFEQLARGKVRGLTANAHLPEGFLHSASNAVDSSPELQAAVGSSPAAIRDAITFGAEYGMVAEELEGLARGIRNTIAVRRSEAGRSALQALAIARRMARNPQHSVLIPHVTDMQKAHNLGRGKGKAKTPPPATT